MSKREKYLIEFRFPHFSNQFLLFGQLQFFFAMSGVLFHLQLLRAWYKIRDTLIRTDIKKALELASVCKHPNAVWLTELFAGRDLDSREEARKVFLGSESDPRAICFAGSLVASLMRFVKLLSLAMRLHKRGRQREGWVRSVFDGLKNLLDRVNAMGSTGLEIATDMEEDVKMMRKLLRRAC
jgi:hypothetical protein